MTDLFEGEGFGRGDKIGALRREIVMRRTVYARRVFEGKMTQDKADREIALMEAILADYEGPGQ